MASWQGVQRALGRWAGRRLPRRLVEGAAAALAARDPQAVVEAVGPSLNRAPDLAGMPVDLPAGQRVAFEELAGLFSSTPLDHAVISMTVRQGAYLFGLIRRLEARKVIEIGRYKGGSTLLIAAALGPEGECWSIDLGEKAARLGGARPVPYDAQLAARCEALGLRVHLLIGDSRTVEVETGEVDLVLIDGDHSYEGVRSDFERFGRRVRVGGAVLLDDACDEGPFRAHTTTVGRLLDELVAAGEFRLVRTVNRMAHLERVHRGAAAPAAAAVAEAGAS